MLLLITFSLFSAVYAALPLPSFITPCARNDPNHNECAKKNGMAAVPFIAKGDKKYNIPPFDPLIVPLIETETADENAPTSFSIKLVNTNVQGLKDVVVEEIKNDLENKNVYWSVRTPAVYASGIYNVSGKILFVPIRGNGDYSFNITDLMFAMTASFELQKKEDGLEYIVIKDSKLDYDLKGFHIFLDNLFDGNKQLGNQVNDFLNENWKEAADAVGPLIAESFNIIFTSILKDLTKQVPYDSVFPESV